MQPHVTPLLLSLSRRCEGHTAWSAGVWVTRVCGHKAVATASSEVCVAVSMQSCETLEQLHLVFWIRRPGDWLGWELFQLAQAVGRAAKAS